MAPVIGPKPELTPLLLGIVNADRRVGRIEDDDPRLKREKCTSRRVESDRPGLRGAHGARKSNHRHSGGMVERRRNDPKSVLKIAQRQDVRLRRVDCQRSQIRQNERWVPDRAGRSCLCALPSMCR